MDHYLVDKETVMQNLDTRESGLSHEESKNRLLANGRNELTKAKKKSLLRRFTEQITNPMVLVLLAAAAVSLIITISEGGSLHEYAEAAIIFAVVILNSVLGVVQESKAEKAIEALQKMSASTAKVRRSGEASQGTRQIVPDKSRGAAQKRM